MNGNNKWLLIVIALTAPAIAWGTWVTTTLYGHDSELAVVKSDVAVKIDQIVDRIPAIEDGLKDLRESLGEAVDRIDKRLDALERKSGNH